MRGTKKTGDDLHHVQLFKIKHIYRLILNYCLLNLNSNEISLKIKEGLRAGERT